LTLIRQQLFDDTANEMMESIKAFKTPQGQYVPLVNRQSSKNPCTTDYKKSFQLRWG